MSIYGISLFGSTMCFCSSLLYRPYFGLPRYDSQFLRLREPRHSYGDRCSRASSHGRANVGDAISQVTRGKIVKFLVIILAANVENVDTWRSVVTRNRINMAKEEANLEENEKAYGP